MVRAVLLLLALGTPSLASEGAFGLTPARYTAWVNSLKAKGLRPRLVSVHLQSGIPVFSAVTINNPDKLDWSAQSGLTSTAFGPRFNQLSKDGYRIESFTIYPTAAGLRIADIWVKDDSINWSLRHGLSAAEFQEHFTAQAKLGYRAVNMTSYLDAGTVKYTLLCHQLGPGEWLAHDGLTVAEYLQRVKDYQAKGLHLAYVSVFHDGKQHLFNMVVEKARSSRPQRLGMTAGELQEEINRQAKAGFQLGGLTGYPTSRGSRYAAFWKPAKRVPLDLPVSGTEVAELAAFDKAMLAYMNEREIECGALCVSRNGRIVLSRGYGFTDRDHTKKTTPTTPFRIASITKPITAALVRSLASEGKFKLSDKAFEYLGVELAPGQKADPRLTDITIQQLLEHKGGFDREVPPVYDPTFQALLIRKELKLRHPPTPRDMIRYMNGRKLDFDPGTKQAYSNYGYCVLGRVIEKATGVTYTASVRAFLKPVGITTITGGRTLPEDRNPLEPFYSDPGFSPNVISGTGNVPTPDGGFCLEMADASGGLIASAPDLARFLDAYWINGEPRKGNGQTWVFFGSLAGTWGMVRQRADGVNIVALFNQLHMPAGKKADEIEGILDKVASSIRDWP